jgi:hypothetical protein
MKKQTAIVVLMFGLAAGSTADTLTLSFFQNATDNLFQTSLPEKDQLSSMAFSYDKPFRPFSFFTEGQYSYLYRNSEVSYYAQDLGLDYLYSFSEKTAFYASAKIGGALYRSAYSDFNYLNFGAIAAVKSYLSPASIVKLNYALNYKDYGYSLFDYHSHLVSLSLDRYFESRTTLKTEAAWGYKYFIHPFLPSAAAVEETVYFGSGNGMGYGSGRMGRRGGYFQASALGRGQGIQVASFSGLIAQGVGDKVGVRISGLRQWTLSGESPFSVIEEFYLVENPSYDQYSWNGYGLSGLLTVEAPWNTQLKMGYTRSLKNFPGIEAMDLEGASLGVLRKDQRNQWDARLERSFSGFSIVLAYSYVDNSSSDPLFKWQGHFLSFGIDWNLNWGGAK